MVVVAGESNEISKAAIRRLLMKSGGKRMGDDAVDELKKILEELAIEIGREAILLVRGGTI